MTDALEKEARKFALSLAPILWLNKMRPIELVGIKEWELFGYRIKYQMRRSNNAWGRFGAGWDWVLGFQAGGSTLIINLLVCSIRISKKPKPTGEKNVA